MATQSQSTESGSNPVPTWLSIPIILLCLAGGGWLIHYYVISDPLSHDVKVLSEPAKTVSQNPRTPGFVGGLFGNGQGGQGGQRQGPGGGGQGGQGGRNQWNATPMPYIRLTNPQKNIWELKTVTARVDVSYAKNKLDLRSITYNGDFFLPPEVRTKIRAAQTIARNTDQALALKLNVGQMQKLNTLASSVNAMVASPDDRELLTTELTKYVQSPESDRAAQDAQLYKSLDEIAQRSTPATIKTAGDRLEEINKIMTPELWQQYSTLPAPGNTQPRPRAIAPAKPVATPTVTPQ